MVGPVPRAKNDMGTTCFWFIQFIYFSQTQPLSTILVDFTRKINYLFWYMIYYIHLLGSRALYINGIIIVSALVKKRLSLSLTTLLHGVGDLRDYLAKGFCQWGKQGGEVHTYSLFRRHGDAVKGRQTLSGSPIWCITGSYSVPAMYLFFEI